jgi:predicted kinase
MNRLHFLIGLPRSGKSTIAESWVGDHIDILGNGIGMDKIDTMFRPYVPRVVVDPDQIRLALGHRWNTFVEPYVASVKDTMIRALLNDHDVLVDETHTTERSMLNLLQIQPGASWYFIDTPSDVCKQRADDTNKSYLKPIIDRMYYNLLNLCGCGWDELKHELPPKIEELRQRALEYKQLERISE